MASQPGEARLASVDGQAAAVPRALPHRRGAGQTKAPPTVSMRLMT